MMVEMGDADGLISGLTQHYPDTIRPALEIIGTRDGVERVSGTYVLMLQDRVFFLADTTVNIEPTPEDLAEIALLTVGFARRFGIVPRVAMLSFSNFGSNKHPAARKVRRAVEIVSGLDPGARDRRRDAGRHGGLRAGSAGELSLEPVATGRPTS